MWKVYSIKQNIFGQVYFSGLALVAKICWMIKNACSMQWKISGHPLFFRASACKLPYNSWMWKVYSKQWKIPGHPLFFRASAGYSKLMNNKKYLFNKVKNIRATLFFRARASCSKIMNVKSIFHTSKNFWATLFFRANASAQNSLNV